MIRTMAQERLNNVLVLHIHKNQMDQINYSLIGKNFQRLQPILKFSSETLYPLKLVNYQCIVLLMRTAI